MELQSIVLLSVLIVVLAIAVVMIVINRRLQKTIREKTHREPTMSKPVKITTRKESRIEEDVYDDDWVEENVEQEELVVNEQQPIAESDESIQEDAAPQGEYIVLGLIADNNHPYAGYELLQSLLSAGLRFGDQQIFHRHETQHGRGEILFSCASATQPGTFELNKMGGFSTPALTLFLNLSKTKDTGLALDAMLDTARQITEDLGGVVFDDERQILADDKVRQWQRRVKQIEESRHTADLFAEV